MRKVIPNTDGTPLCLEDDHDWIFTDWDPDVGMNGLYRCKACGAEDHESPPPADDDYFPF